MPPPPWASPAHRHERQLGGRATPEIGAAARPAPSSSRRPAPPNAIAAVTWHRYRDAQSQIPKGYRPAAAEPRPEWRVADAQAARLAMPGGARHHAALGRQPQAARCAVAKGRVALSRERSGAFGAAYERAQVLQGRRLESRLLEAFANARAADPEDVPVLWLTAAPNHRLVPNSAPS